VRRPWPFKVQQRSWLAQAADCLPTQGSQFEEELELYFLDPLQFPFPQRHRPPEAIPDPFKEN
jgi:hypothetical protein